jgi:hypothetical protein
MTWQDELVGDFHSLLVDPLFTSQGLAFGLDYVNPTGAGSLTLSAYLAGDFDRDGDVDGFDFLAWQRGGSPNPLSQSDLADWETNYGTVLPPPLTDSAAVPEPSALVLLCLGGLLASRSSRHATTLAA